MDSYPLITSYQGNIHFNNVKFTYRFLSKAGGQLKMHFLLLEQLLWISKRHLHLSHLYHFHKNFIWHGWYSGCYVDLKTVENAADFDRARLLRINHIARLLSCCTVITRLNRKHDVKLMIIAFITVNVIKWYHFILNNVGTCCY